jgi:indole-3-glycerol phosphate synthase
VSGRRHFSQAISEGDGISIVVAVAEADEARRAREQGAEAIVVDRNLASVRDATELPILWLTGGSLAELRDSGADAIVLPLREIEGEGALEALYGDAGELGIDCVVEVRDEDELEEALERLDPEVLLLSPEQGRTLEEKLEQVLELLPDVPAGKLAVARLDELPTREQVAELERAGIDAVIVGAGNVAEIVGGSGPGA